MSLFSKEMLRRVALNAKEWGSFLFTAVFGGFAWNQVRQIRSQQETDKIVDSINDGFKKFSKELAKLRAKMEEREQAKKTWFQNIEELLKRNEEFQREAFKVRDSSG